MNHHHHNEHENNDHQPDDRIKDDNVTQGEDGSVNHHRHHEATVTVKDWVAVASNDPNRTTNSINNKVVNSYNKDDVEAALFGKLTDDEGLILKQFLLLQETEHQHQLILKDKKYELILERKNAEIAKQQHELELFKLRYATLENDIDTTAVKGKTKGKSITPFDTKISKNREEEQQQHKDNKADISAETLFQNYLDKMEQKMNENNTIILEKVDDRFKRMETKTDPTTSKSLQVMIQNLPVIFQLHGINSYKTFVVSTWPPMTLGKHKWTIKCSSSSSSFPFYCIAGLITVSDHLQHKKQFMSEHLGYDIRGWGYYNGGDLWYDKYVQKKGLPRFSPGDNVTFVLDLGIKAHNKNTASSGDGHNGILYVCVNDGEQHLLVSDLSNFVISNHGFLPAVSLFGYCHVNVCDYEFVLE